MLPHSQSATRTRESAPAGSGRSVKRRPSPHKAHAAACAACAAGIQTFCSSCVGKRPLSSTRTCDMPAPRMHVHPHITSYARAQGPHTMAHVACRGLRPGLPWQRQHVRMHESQNTMARQTASALLTAAAGAERALGARLALGTSHSHLPRVHMRRMHAAGCVLASAHAAELLTLELGRCARERRAIGV